MAVGTLIFSYIYVGLDHFLEFKISIFIFWGFSEKMDIFFWGGGGGGMMKLWIFGVITK